jgi:hypothetical protein
MTNVTGLLQSGMLAASIARAPVLIFFDGHCEVNRDWLQPLVSRIKEVSEAFANESVISNGLKCVGEVAKFRLFHLAVDLPPK